MLSTRKSWIEKLNEVKILLKKKFPELEVHNVQEKMSNIAHYHYNKKNSMLLGGDRKIYNVLIENGFNPYTVYRWILLEKIPEDIRFRLNEQQISQKKAFSLAMNRRRETDSSLSKSLRQMGLQLVRCM